MVAGVDDGAEEESGDWGAGGEEDAVVFDSAGVVRFVMGWCMGVRFDLLDPKDEGDNVVGEVKSVTEGL